MKFRQTQELGGQEEPGTKSLYILSALAVGTKAV